MLVASVLAQQTADSISGSLFGVSLFPWLIMLYFLSHPTTKAPEGVTFGLWFLLVFVFGSIPAAIFSENLYGATLADVDWLHGAAESLLAVTNCVIVLGFRDALRGSQSTLLQRGAWLAAVLAAGTTVIHVATGFVGQHSAWLLLQEERWYTTEPDNALSFATWIIHTSSLVEWLVAMGLCWSFASASGTPQYKGLTWGMLPLHTSGIIACTYHLFFNSLSACVTFQAFMTCLGNCTMAFAAFRLARAKGWTLDDLLYQRSGKYGEREDPLIETASQQLVRRENTNLPGWEDLGDAWNTDTDLAFVSKVIALSVGSALAVKALPAFVPEAAFQDFLNNDDALQVATFAIILIPTALNVYKWVKRSNQSDLELPTF